MEKEAEKSIVSETWKCVKSEKTENNDGSLNQVKIETNYFSNRNRYLDEISKCVKTEKQSSKNENISNDILNLMDNLCVEVEKKAESESLLHMGNEFVDSLVQVMDNTIKTEIQRCNSVETASDDSSSVISSDDSISSDSSESDWSPPIVNNPVIDLTEEKRGKNKQNNFTLEDMPEIKDLDIKLPDDAKLVAFGKISSIIENQLVVIQSLPNQPALAMDTVLFFDKETAIGMIDETFGPVSNPYYVIRFRDAEHLLKYDIEVGKEVYFAPYMEKFTSFIFISELRKIRGSDASWMQDMEPPPEHIDYSDDEQERLLRKRKTNKRAINGEEATNDDDKKDSTSTEKIKPHTQKKQPRPKKKDKWHNQQTRYTVPDHFEAMHGWNNAINQMQNMRHQMRHHHVPPMNSLFQNMPMPPSPSNMCPRFPTPPPFYQRFDCPPPGPPPENNSQFFRTRSPLRHTAMQNPWHQFMHRPPDT